MDDTFHRMWLIIGDSANKYTKPYDIIPLQEAEEYSEAEVSKLSPGYTCHFGNRLRNGNCKLGMSLSENSNISIEKIVDSRTKALYNCGENLLAMHHGMWALYNSKTLSKIAEGPWGNDESSYFCFDSGFFIFDEVLLHYSLQGFLLAKIFVTSGSDLKHHEIALIGEHTISAGYLKASSFPDGLPGVVQPSGQLESFKLGELEVPDEPDEILEPSETNMLAFVEEDPLIPVYLDEMLVQPLDNKIALISFNLNILKVLEGDFLPLAVSANEKSIIYMTALVENEMVLMAFDTGGQIIFTIDIPKKLGKCMSPPLISANANIYWVGENGVSTFNESGELLWSRYYSAQPEHEIYPLLYDDILTIGNGSNFIVYNAEGEIMAITEIEDEIINTPLISNKQGRYFIGMESGLYEIKFHSD